MNKKTRRRWECGWLVYLNERNCKYEVNESEEIFFKRARQQEAKRKNGMKWTTHERPAVLYCYKTATWSGGLLTIYFFLKKLIWPAVLYCYKTATSSGGLLTFLKKIK